MDIFKIDHIITLYNFDKITEILSVEIEYDKKIDNIDFSEALLTIASDKNLLLLDKQSYLIIKFNYNSYYLDIKDKSNN